MFKTGDKVRATNSTGCGTQFTKGNVYIVENVTGDCVNIVADDEGKSNGWIMEFFELVTISEIDWFELNKEFS